MALVVLLRGVNVGGHRRFRPSVLAEELAHLGAVNVGAAGTLVIRKPIGRAQLRTELARRLPFAAEVVICSGREIAGMRARDPFAGRAPGPGEVRFVSFLARRPRAAPPLPLRFPSRGRWLLKIIARDGRFVFGTYRRHMKVIGYLGALDRLFGAPATTRNWTTVAAIARVLDRSRDQ